MGRVKTLQVKRVTHELMDLYGTEFTDSYEKNKIIVNKFISTPSKKLRNVIAGYVTRLAKKSNEPKKTYTHKFEDIDSFYG